MTSGRAQHQRRSSGRTSRHSSIGWPWFSLRCSRAKAPLAEIVHDQGGQHEEQPRRLDRPAAEKWPMSANKASAPVTVRNTDPRDEEARQSMVQQGRPRSVLRIEPPTGMPGSRRMCGARRLPAMLTNQTRADRPEPSGPTPGPSRGTAIQEKATSSTARLDDDHDRFRVTCEPYARQRLQALHRRQHRDGRGDHRVGP